MEPENWIEVSAWCIGSESVKSQRGSFLARGLCSNLRMVLMEELFCNCPCCRGLALQCDTSLVFLIRCSVTHTTLYSLCDIRSSRWYSTFPKWGFVFHCFSFLHSKQVLSISFSSVTPILLHELLVANIFSEPWGQPLKNPMFTWLVLPRKLLALKHTRGRNPVISYPGIYSDLNLFSL